MSNVLEGIITFNQERNLHDFNHEAEARMLKEEFQEFVNADSEHMLVDALCDLIVVSTGALYKLGYSPEDAIKETLKEINSRNGLLNLETGKWEKDLNQDPSTLYKANYVKVV